MIRFNSDEFKAWHEVGHATICLHLGGNLDCIEFLNGDAQGFAVARGCRILPETEKSVACGGFAAEFYLLNAGCVEGVDLSTKKGVEEASYHVFSNSWRDLQDFIGRSVTEDNDFTKEEKERFMNYAIQYVSPVFNLYFEKMKLVVHELLAERAIKGKRVRELLKIGITR